VPDDPQSSFYRVRDASGGAALGDVAIWAVVLLAPAVNSGREAANS